MHNTIRRQVISEILRKHNDEQIHLEMISSATQISLGADSDINKPLKYPLF